MLSEITEKKKKQKKIFKKKIFEVSKKKQSFPAFAKGEDKTYFN